MATALLLVRDSGSVHLDLCVDDGRLVPARERVCDQLATRGADGFGARRDVGGSACSSLWRAGAALVSAVR